MDSLAGKFPGIIFLAQIKDTLSLKDLIGKIHGDPDPGNKPALLIKTHGFYLFGGTWKDYLIVSTDESYISELKMTEKIENSVLTEKYAEYLAGKPVNMFINFMGEDLSEYYHPPFNDDLPVEKVKDLNKLLESIIISGGLESGDIEVNFRDKSTNSLHLILKSFDKELQ
jgi:hypothetical protein